MNNNNDYTNEEYLNSKNKKEIANINSIGENIINDKNISPNGLGNNSLYKIRNQLNRPEIINDNRIINDDILSNDILSNDIIVNKKQIPIDTKNNIKIVIENIEPTEVTKELKILSNKSNNNKSNNNKSNNNNNSNIRIILKELQQIFPLSIIIAIIIFILIFIYIVRF
jgi:hypothetical protein